MQIASILLKNDKIEREETNTKNAKKISGHFEID
jgi:hypothetical protein